MGVGGTREEGEGRWGMGWRVGDRRDVAGYERERGEGGWEGGG